MIHVFAAANQTHNPSISLVPDSLNDWSADVDDVVHNNAAAQSVRAVTSLLVHVDPKGDVPPSLVPVGPNVYALLLLPLLSVIGFIGNAMVCIAIATDRRLQNVTNYFLFSLALADLLVCSIVMPLAMLAEIRHGVWTWSFGLCVLYAYSDVCLCSASIVHMSVISLDRYLGISKPLKTRNKSRTIVFFKITLVWVVTFVISSPLAVLAHMDSENILHNNQCAIANQLYMIYGSTLSFLIPFVIMAVTYVKTTQLLNKQASLLSQRTNDRFHNGLRRTLPHRKLGQIRTNSCNLSSISNVAASPGALPQTPTGLTAGHKISTVSLTAPLKPHNGDVKNKLVQQNSSSTETEEVHLIKKSSDPGIARRTPPLLHKQSSAIKLQIGKIKTRTSNVLTSITTRVGGRRNSLQAASMELANEHKATRVLAVVFICFFICWTPFFLTNIAFGFCGPSFSVPPWIASIFLWLGYISSIINPIIYTIFNRRFRQAFLRILRCQCLHSIREANISYSRNHTYVPTDAWSTYDKSIATSTGKDIVVQTPANGRTFTPPCNIKASITTSTRCHSASSGQVALQNSSNTPDFWKRVRCDSTGTPDSLGPSGQDWSAASTPPLKQALFTSYKNRPTAFPLISESSKNLPDDPAFERPISGADTPTSYRSRPRDDGSTNPPAPPMQISDYDNNKSEAEKRMQPTPSTSISLESIDERPEQQQQQQQQQRSPTPSKTVAVSPRGNYMNSLPPTGVSRCVPVSAKIYCASPSTVPRSSSLNSYAGINNGTSVIKSATVTAQISDPQIAVHAAVKRSEDESSPCGLNKPVIITETYL